jgi:hypothetical protein
LPLPSTTQKRCLTSFRCGQIMYRLSLLVQVHFYTNCDVAETGETRKGKKKPQLVVTYNYKMHGVDKADAFANLYLYKHRKVPPVSLFFAVCFYLTSSQKSWKRAVLFLLLKQAAVNAWLIHSSMQGRESQREFLEKLCSVFSPSSSSIQTSPHIPIPLEKSCLCEHCKRTKKKSYTTFTCQTCKVPLHPKCFGAFHGMTKQGRVLPKRDARGHFQVLLPLST